MKLLLITGVPGTGKKTIGNYLAEKHAFYHLDVELLTGWSTELQNLFSNSLTEFVIKLKRINRDIVLTWGFMPGIHDTTVRHLQNQGFTMIWFDGNREAAKKAFLKRNTVDAYYLGLQMERIENMDIDSFNPVIINTFNKNGDFLSEKDIVELLNQTSHA